jgi:hypothetical protein
MKYSIYDTGGQCVKHALTTLIPHAIKFCSDVFSDSHADVFADVFNLTHSHMQEYRHAHGMRCLNIPNTKHFHDITFIQVKMLVLIFVISVLFA